MEFRILGPLEVVDGERTLPLGARKRRALLAVLLLRRGQVVSVDEIVEALWGAEPPRTAEHSIQVYVSELRKVLGADPDADAPVAITLQPPGYAMRIPSEALDVNRSERLAERGRAAMAAGDPGNAAALLGEALDLWRGPPLADFAYDDFARGDIEALEELRLATTEDRIDADLALGRHAETVAELQTLVDAHPFRERLRTSLMLALYRSGRQAEALQEFHRARTLLADDLGIDPGHELSGLAAAILAQDPALAWRPSATNEPSTHPPVGDTADAGTPQPVPPPPETSPARRIVSVLVAELQVRDADGASIDPEASAPLATRASVLVGVTLERHGATVLPRDGSALVALFGSPVAHEDDALRSVRAAAEIRERVDGLNAELTDDRGFAVTTRIGVHTGEILSGGDDDPAALASEAIQRARHLAANPGGAGPVLDDTTLALVKDAVTVAPLDRTSGMYRLVEVHPRASGWSRRMDSPIVGRDAELADLARSFERVHATRSCVLLTVFGDAGIGKTRLVDEFTQRVANDAQVLEGRCLAYGDGITYWPIAEAIRAVASVHDDDGAADIRRKLADNLADDADRERIVQGLSHILGVADIELSQGETLWAVRRFLGSLATDGPVVLLVEDVHWAEPTLLDLLESIADWMRDTQLLVICTARPDIFDQRPGWGGGRPNVATLALRPLSPEDTDLLIENLVHHPGLDAEAKSRIAEAAEGNPLFVEQLLSMLVDEGLLRQDAGQWSLATDLSSVSLPTSLQTLLSARLDRLPASHRSVLGIASVIGRTFDVETVEALTSPEERDGVRASVHRLVAKDLVRPERTPDGDRFRFRHVLIMNATYEALPKRRRAELHEVIADRLEATAGEQAAGYDEIVGDHLARAAGYLQELAPDDEHVRALRDRSGRRLVAGAARAFARGDMPAAASLYATAARMLPADDPQRLAFLPELGNAFIEIGRMDDADRVFAEAINEGTRRDDLRVVADALLYRFEAEVWRGMMDEAKESVALARQLIPQAEATGDDLVQQRAWSILGMWAPSWAEQEEFTQRAMRFAERAGDLKGRNENIQMASGLLHMGPMPVEDALRVSQDYLERTAGDRVMEAAIIVNARAPLLARAGQMTDARAEYERARTTFRELGLPLWLAASGTIGPSIAELVAGDPTIAHEMTEEAIARLEHINARGNWLVDVLQLYADALLGLGRTQEAGAAIARLEKIARPTDPFLHWVRGSLALAEGRSTEAIAEMRIALQEADDDWLPARGGMTLDLAQALRADGSDDEARQTAAQALEIFERKGDVVSATRARAFLESG